MGLISNERNWWAKKFINYKGKLSDSLREEFNSTAIFVIP